MDQIQHFLFNVLLYIAAILCIHDSIILFIRGRHNKPRLMLGITTITWGLMYIVLIISSMNHLITYPLFSGEALISSHIFICLMFLFPLEVLLPGWLNAKRTLVMITPICILSLIYFIGLKLTGQHIERLMTFNELMDSLGDFNVWYRFIIFFCNLVFLFFLWKLLNQNELKYKKWQNENFSDLENVDISWMKLYKKMMSTIIICYVIVSIWGSIWSIIIHTFIVIISFSILFYKALFYEDKYSEEFIDNQTIRKGYNLTDEIPEIQTGITNKAIDNTFQAQIPVYIQRFKTWMEEDKPYLYRDFKLLDVNRILPLNRSYLSRLFNEGFQQNFSEVVRSYRIEYAKKLLIEHPEFPIYKVADMSGFSSASTFNKAFLQTTGCTPKQFKE